LFQRFSFGDRLASGYELQVDSADHEMNAENKSIEQKKEKIVSKEENI
jgi:hypothetical protein